jgi:phosphoglycolate phosphatase
MSSPSFRAAIFDLDGTLADSVEDVGGAMNEVLAARGYPQHDLPTYRRFVGDGIEMLIRRAVPAEALEQVPQLLVEYRARYGLRLDSKTTLYPGIQALLDALVAAGVKLAVLSNKREEFTRELVRRLLPGVPFLEVRGEREGTPRKPDPTSALEVAAALGVPPAQCVFVGDTAVDMKTAVCAGMMPVGVLWGFRGREELVEGGARALLSSAVQLMGVRIEGG